MEIKILGPGCAKCKAAYKVVEKVVKENSLDAQLSKVEDILEIMSYNIMSTPAIVIDGTVKNQRTCTNRERSEKSRWYINKTGHGNKKGVENPLWDCSNLCCGILYAVAKYSIHDSNKCNA